MSKGYCKTVITVTVLSEGPYDYRGLASLAYDMDEGDCVGMVTCAESAPLDAGQMREALLAAGNDGAFFDLDAED